MRSSALRWMERALLLGAVLCLSWVFITWRQATSYQARAKRALEAVAASQAPPSAVESTDVGEPAIDEGSLVGLLEIGRLGMSLAVVEGDETQILKTSVGHLSDTPLPWHAGNVALAGHRDTFFRPLENLRVGDAIDLATRHGTFHYRVGRLLIVTPDALWVLDQDQGVNLTLITCYPFTYIGPAPRRFVVQAQRDPAFPSSSQSARPAVDARLQK